MAVRKALIVDDSKVARFTLARRLQGHGLTVLSAESAADAMEQLRGEKPDVIFMDFMMPEVNGLEAAQRLAADTATADIPIIMCTGNDASELNMASASQNVRGLLTKGSDDQQLMALLDDLAATPVPEQAAAEESAPATEAIDLDALVRAASERAVEAAGRHAQETVERLLGERIAGLRGELEQGLNSSLQNALREHTQERSASADGQAPWAAEADSRIEAASARLREEFNQRLGTLAADAKPSSAEDQRLQDAMAQLQELQAEVERLATEQSEGHADDDRDLLDEITRHSAEHAVGLVNELRGEFDGKLRALAPASDGPDEAMSKLKTDILAEMERRLGEYRSMAERNQPDENQLREWLQSMTNGIEERAIAAAVSAIPEPQEAPPVNNEWRPALEELRADLMREIDQRFSALPAPVASGVDAAELREQLDEHRAETEARGLALYRNGMLYTTLVLLLAVGAAAAVYFL